MIEQLQNRIINTRILQVYRMTTRHSQPAAKFVGQPSHPLCCSDIVAMISFLSKDKINSDGIMDPGILISPVSMT